MPAFRKPKSKNAATTLLLLGTLAVTMLIGIVVLDQVPSAVEVLGVALIVAAVAVHRDAEAL